MPRDVSRKDGAVGFLLLAVPGVLIKQLEMTRSFDLSLVIQKATLSSLCSPFRLNNEGTNGNSFSSVLVKGQC